MSTFSLEERIVGVCPGEGWGALQGNCLNVERVPEVGKAGDAGPTARSGTREGSVLYAEGFGGRHKAPDNL